MFISLCLASSTHLKSVKFICDIFIYEYCSLLLLVQFFATPWTVARQASLSSTVSWSLLKFMSIELVIIFNHLILCCPILLFAFNLSQHQSLFQ